MDYSKLPKLSQTPAPPTEQRPTDDVPPQVSPTLPMSHPQSADSTLGAEIWISAVIGLVVIMMSWNFARYLGATLAGKPFHTNVVWQTGDRAGEEVAYFDLDGYTAWSESAMFVFGIALLLEAAALWAASGTSRGRRQLIAIAFSITLIATVYNAIVAIMLFSIGLMPIISILIIGFGGYMAAYQWRLLALLRRDLVAAQRTI